MGNKHVDFNAILEAPDKEAITQYVIDRELNEFKYGRPSKWFEDLEGRMKLSCPTPEEVGQIAEAKACRDVLVHNQGIANKTYVTKAGTKARFKEGERIHILEDYHRQIWELLRKVVADMSNAAIKKFS